MESLFDKLQKYGESDIYPYHMPGHKRHECGGLPRHMYLRDITEIDGFDNLHQPEGDFLILQQRAAGIYGAEESYYLVNGSTGGILSAVSAALPAGGHILMARNCHKAAFHGAYLRNLRISYLYPKPIKEYDIFDGIAPEQVGAALEQEPDIAAVLLVSPTYEGRISKIREIAELVHRKGIPLIVDEAHGAHLGLAAGLAENSCQAGADFVIHSVHKTLPALTQTALLHVNGNLIDRELLRRFLHIYQSSSPSYLLMASIDNALQNMALEGERAFSDFLTRWSGMQERLAACRHLRFPSGDKDVQDPGKLLISVKGTDMSGRRLYDRLLQDYHLQLEMAAETYALAMFTVNDTEEGYERMTKALLEIDQGMTGTGSREDDWSEKTCDFFCKPDKEAIPLAGAWDMKKATLRLEESIGYCAGEFVNLYPPGIPVLVPGEHITKELYQNICRWIEQGLTVQGIETRQEDYFIKVINKKDL